jgi:hypothetical protein
MALLAPYWVLNIPKLAMLLVTHRSSVAGLNVGGTFSSFSGVAELDRMGVMVDGVTADSLFEAAFRGLIYQTHDWSKNCLLQFLDRKAAARAALPRDVLGCALLRRV